MAVRPLGTMVTYGYPGVGLEDELKLAIQIGASLLEILPEWSQLPDPVFLRQHAADRGLGIHSAHGCWGGRTIRARQVDLGSTDASTHRESVDDLKNCVDWLARAGGRYLVVHPGGLSVPRQIVERRHALGRGLVAVADHARGSDVIICVENMPPGVYPGSKMQDLADLVAALAHPGIALALDTGHANISGSLETETIAAGSFLATTHVHDNDGKADSHEPPGHGSIDWPQWGRALDLIDYRGPILLECIRLVRRDPSRFRPDVVNTLLGRPSRT